MTTPLGIVDQLREAASDVSWLWKDAAAEIERLQTENWQLKQACGYPIPADKETIDNPFKCGMCDARRYFPVQDAPSALPSEDEIAELVREYAEVSIDGDDVRISGARAAASMILHRVKQALTSGSHTGRIVDQ